jgi:TrbC/VIRB2 pilin
MKFFTNKNMPVRAALAVFALGLHGAAFAGAGAAGGLSVAQSTASNIATALFGFASVGAGVYLLYLGLMAWSDKKTWGDFGMGVVHVSLVGGSLALSTWAWALFSS